MKEKLAEGKFEEDDQQNDEGCLQTEGQQSMKTPRNNKEMNDIKVD